MPTKKVIKAIVERERERERANNLFVNQNKFSSSSKNKFFLRLKLVQKRNKKGKIVNGSDSAMTTDLD